MTALQVEPVIEVVDDEAFDLWPAVGRAGFWRIPLHGTMTDAEVGTAVLPGCRYSVDERFEILDVLDGAATHAQRHASQLSDAVARALEAGRHRPVNGDPQ